MKSFIILLSFLFISISAEDLLRIVKPLRLYLSLPSYYRWECSYLLAQHGYHGTGRVTLLANDTIRFQCGNQRFEVIDELLKNLHEGIAGLSNITVSTLQKTPNRHHLGRRFRFHRDEVLEARGHGHFEIHLNHQKSGKDEKIEGSGLSALFCQRWKENCREALNGQRMLVQCFPDVLNQTMVEHAVCASVQFRFDYSQDLKRILL